MVSSYLGAFCSGWGRLCNRVLDPRDSSCIDSSDADCTRRAVRGRMDVGPYSPHALRLQCIDVKVQESLRAFATRLGELLYSFHLLGHCSFSGVSTHVYWQIVTKVFVSGSSRVSHEPFAL
jgi:hypothetical protein